MLRRADTARQRSDTCSSRKSTRRRSPRCGAGTRSARRTSAPGLTGVSHWVEHMNFKGTTNIPRDQVKGIIEQFGGSWNGYTWIDQTTYLETATRDALDRMLFIESERMANCLYHPDDCESERTVIISELHGGENDPDQLLDQELDRDGVQGASVPAPDDRLARRSRDDDARRPVRLLPAVLRPQQRHARHRRRRGHRRGAAPRRSTTSEGSAAGAMPPRPNTARAGADGRAARDDPERRHDRVSEGRRITRRRSTIRGSSRCSCSTPC